MADPGRTAPVGASAVSAADQATALTPEALADLLPSRSVFPALTTALGNVKVQMYRHPPGGIIGSPEPSDHVLVVNMGGTALIDDTSDEGHQLAWASAGCFSLTPAGQAVSRSWKGRPEVLLIYLDPGFVDEVALDLDLDPTNVRLTPRLAVPDEALHHFGVLLRSEAADPDGSSALMVDSLARGLVVQLLRRHSNRQMPPPMRAPPLQSHRLMRVMDYMQAHLDAPLSLPELAKLCGLSTMHFSRAFRAAVGMPPHAYLVDLRLEKARAMLEQTDILITEIAFRCGFEQSQYFATVFRRKLGFTPSEWRHARAG